MGLIEGWTSIFNRLASGRVAQGAHNLTDSYVGAWCNVVQKYPRLVGVPLYGRWFVSNVCPPLGYPDPPFPPPPPIIEAPCDGVQYEVFLNITRQFNNNPPTTYTSPRLLVYGALQEINIRQSPSQQTSFLEGYVIGYDANGNEKTVTTPVGGVGFTAVLNYYEIFRVDGLPNNTNCYDPYQDLPPDPEIFPPDFNPVVPVPRNDDSGNPLPPINIPITININPDVDLNVDLDIGGNKYDIDFEGFKKRDDPLTIEPKPVPLPEELEEEVVEDEEIEKEGIIWAKVTVTQLPTRGKRLVSASSADVDHFAGFFSWTSNVSGEKLRMQEIAIRKRKYIFRAPEGATGMRYYPVNGAILSVSVFTQEEA